MSLKGENIIKRRDSEQCTTMKRNSFYSNVTDDISVL